MRSVRTRLIVFTLLIFTAAAVAVLFLSAFSVSADNETEGNGEEDGAAVSQETIVSGDYSYYLKTGNYGDKVAVLEKYTGSASEVVIPNGVTGIARGAFEGCTTLKSVTIPDSVQRIGYSAFAGCTALKSVTIPNGVIEIERCAFTNCTSLEKITLPERLRYKDIVEGCTGLADSDKVLFKDRTELEEERRRREAEERRRRAEKERRQYEMQDAWYTAMRQGGPY